MNKVVSDTLQQTKWQNLDGSDFNSIFKKEIISEYLIRENDGSKGQRLADKILDTLGVRIWTIVAQISPYAYFLYL